MTFFGRICHRGTEIALTLPPLGVVESGSTQGHRLLCAPFKFDPCTLRACEIPTASSLVCLATGAGHSLPPSAQVVVLLPVVPMAH